MTIDKSLKIRAGGIRNRNVLTRAERLERLKVAERWKDGDEVMGLPKVKVIKLSMKKKKKVKKEEEGAEGSAAAPAAAAGAKAPAAKAPAVKAPPAKSAAKK